MKPSNITPDIFTSWRKNQGWSRIVAALKLGISKSTIDKYELGSRTDSEKPVIVPMVMALAMSALTHNLKPYGEDSDVTGNPMDREEGATTDDADE